MSELLTTENCLPLTVETIVDLQFKCLQQMQLLTLHLEIDGYISGLLYGFLYFSRIGDLIGESLTLRWLRKILLDAPCKWKDDAECNFKGVTLTVGKRALKFIVERGICTRDTECNRRGEIETFNLFVIAMMSVVYNIPSCEKRHSYRLWIRDTKPDAHQSSYYCSKNNKNPQNITKSSKSPKKRSVSDCYQRDTNTSLHMAFNVV